MDPATALADLLEISSDVEAAAVFGEDGPVVASTSVDATRTDRLVRAGRGLLEAAEGLPTAQERRLVRLEAALGDGSVFVVRGSERAIVATTRPAPASTLVVHDLETCLRAVAEALEKPAAKPRRAPRKKKPADA